MRKFETIKAMQEEIEFTAKARVKAVEKGIDYNQPTFIFGDVGIGKSQGIYQVCQKNGWAFMDVRLSQIDPTDLRGVPVYNPTDKRADFIKFDSVLPDQNHTGVGILLFDEMPQADDMIKSACYQIINDRKLGDYHLPKLWTVIGSGNRDQDGGVYFEFPKALKDRFQFFELEVDHKGFIDWMFKKYGKTENKWSENILSYLSYQLHNDKTKIYKSSMQHYNFPTLRSWEKAIMAIMFGKEENLAIADAVGEDIAVDYNQFINLVKEIPDAKTLIDKKKYYKNIAKQIVSCQKVSKYIIEKSPKYESFQYFMDMHNPENKDDQRSELTVLFLSNLMDNMKENQVVLDKLNQDFIDTKSKHKLPYADLWTAIFKRFQILMEL